MEQYMTGFRILERSPNSARIEVGGDSHQFYFAKEGSAIVVWHNGTTYRIERQSSGSRDERPTGDASGEIRAPMPGKVLSVNVGVGSDVAERDTVLTLESMKMETSLRASKQGRVT